MFEGLGGELPWLTQMLVDFSDGLVLYWYIPLLILAGIIVLFKSVASTSNGRYIIDRALLRLPILARLSKNRRLRVLPVRLVPCLIQGFLFFKPF
jgi:type II secretory pathway component PulF